VQEAIIATGPRAAAIEGSRLFRGVEGADLIIQGNIHRADALSLAAAVEGKVRGALSDVREFAVQPYLNEKSGLVGMGDKEGSNQSKKGSTRHGSMQQVPLQALLFRPSNWPPAAQDYCLVPGLSSLLGTCGRVL